LLGALTGLMTLDLSGCDQLTEVPAWVLGPAQNSSALYGSASACEGYVWK